VEGTVISTEALRSNLSADHRRLVEGLAEEESLDGEGHSLHSPNIWHVDVGLAEAVVWL
jgi:hypothetical protein